MQFINAQPGQKFVYGCELNHLALLYASGETHVIASPVVGSYVLVPNMISAFSGRFRIFMKHIKRGYIRFAAPVQIFFTYIR